MSISEVKSMVATVSSFQTVRCFQFGFYDSKNTVHRVVVGEDVTRLGLKNWERPINVSPKDPIWMALFLAPLIKAGRHEYKVAVTYPYSLKSEFEQYGPQGKIRVILPDYENGGETTKTISLLEVAEIPEAYAHATAYHNYLARDCVVISIGFGTIEMGMVDKSAQIFEPRLSSVTFGLHKAAAPFRTELKKLGYDDSDARIKDQDHIYDGILQRVIDEAEGKEGGEPVNLIVRGGALTKKDLIEPAKQVLDNYASALVPHIKDYIESQNYTSNIDIVLTGGGVNYPVLVDRIKAALAQYNLKNVTVATKEAAKYSAALGITTIAQKLFDESPYAMGIDVGNNSVLFDSTDHVADDKVAVSKKLPSRSSPEYVFQ